MWAFNSKLPAGLDMYDEAQFKHLDYIVASAGKRNLKLVLALGNLWNAYMAPEDFLKWATGSSGECVGFGPPDLLHAGTTGWYH